MVVLPFRRQVKWIQRLQLQPRKVSVVWRFQDVQSILDGTCTLQLIYRADSPPLNANTITQDSDDEEGSASQSEVRSKSKYYLNTENSSSYKEQSNSQTDTQNRRDSTNSEQGDIKLPVPEKAGSSSSSWGRFTWQGAVREVDESLYVQVGDSPEASGD